MQISSTPILLSIELGFVLALVWRCNRLAPTESNMRPVYVYLLWVTAYAISASVLGARGVYISEDILKLLPGFWLQLIPNCSRCTTRRPVWKTCAMACAGLSIPLPGTGSPIFHGPAGRCFGYRLQNHDRRVPGVFRKTLSASLTCYSESQPFGWRGRPSGTQLAQRGS